MLIPSVWCIPSFRGDACLGVVQDHEHDMSPTEDMPSCFLMTSAARCEWHSWAPSKTPHLHVIATVTDTPTVTHAADVLMPYHCFRIHD